MLFFGDMGLGYLSGEVLCEECAPTWADSAHDWELPEIKEAEPEGYISFQTAFAAHRAKGGLGDDKHLQIL